MSPSKDTPDRPWIGVLLFGLGVALVTAILSPEGFTAGLIFGFLGGTIIALGLSVILRTNKG